MEHFFTPAEPAQDCYECIPSGYDEVHLAVPIETFLNHRWDWSDFRAFATGGDEGGMGKILWIAEDTFCWVENENPAMEYDLYDRHHGDCDLQRAAFTTPSGERHALVLAKDVYSVFCQPERPAFSGMQ
jgi:hypothetical protein